MKHPNLISIGTATPNGVISQADAADLECALAPGAEPEQARTIRALYRRAGVRSRGSVLSDAEGGQEFFRADSVRGPTTTARGRMYRLHAGLLAEQAARRALSLAEIPPGSITHLVTASCTGFDAPGPDQHLIRSIGLPASVRRTHIGFMGCHAAINALAVASAFAADPAARVLVCCVELCSLHYAYQADAERLVANALFADGAAAAVVGRHEVGGPRIRRTDAIIIPDSADQMTWMIGDHGFEMRLSPRVPEVLARHVPGWVEGWLAEERLTPGDVPSWAIHPGGPRVLSAVRESLGLKADTDSASRAVLADHGNMSSATVLFIMEKLLRAGDGLPLVALAFGPGLAGEGLLLTRE